MDETERRAEFEATGKYKINNLLWALLPDDTTLKEAETIACEIYSVIITHFNNKRGEG